MCDHSGTSANLKTVQTACFFSPPPPPPLLSLAARRDSLLPACVQPLDSPLSQQHPRNQCTSSRSQGLPKADPRAFTERDKKGNFLTCFSVVWSAPCMCVVGCAFFSRALWVRGASSGLGRSVLSAHRWRGGGAEGACRGVFCHRVSLSPVCFFFLLPSLPFHAR